MIRGLHKYKHYWPSLCSSQSQCLPRVERVAVDLQAVAIDAAKPQCSMIYKPGPTTRGWRWNRNRTRMSRCPGDTGLFVSQDLNLGAPVPTMHLVSRLSHPCHLPNGFVRLQDRPRWQTCELLQAANL